MADAADLAADREQQFRDIALAKARTTIATLPPCGQCYNCLSSLPAGVKFCDCDCRNDYQARRSVEARRG